MKRNILFVVALAACLSMLAADNTHLLFNRAFDPAQGLTLPQERPWRDEVCLNGYWQLQMVDVPPTWERGSGVAPELTAADPDKWETVMIKVPSPINVNNWGQGYRTGEGTDRPYTPSSVYYPSYPEHWNHARMAWMRRPVEVPADWDGFDISLHFEAVAGDCVVLVNGQEAARNFDSHLPFDVDITPYVKAGETAEVMLGLRHTRLFDKSHPLYKMMGATYPTGSNTDDLIGIWQDVMMQRTPRVKVADVFVQPLLDQNKLLLQVQLLNTSGRDAKVALGGEVKPWINHAGQSVLDAPEINWSLGDVALKLPSTKTVKVKAGQTVTVDMEVKVTDQLDAWTPDSPNLYVALVDVLDGKKVVDRKGTRFGWRQFTIVGDELHLNGEKMQCFGDIQHPFSAYVCSRRYAYAWLRMIKDFGGNAVRPHAQPWPRVYCDLADEMGLMVLDETALFGSSIRLNFEEPITWERSKRHLERLVMRDRNHPSVMGWSAGNECFAIALLNKPDSAVAAKWDDSLVALTKVIAPLDPTRQFITLDGDADMGGRLPVYSKHHGHGLYTNDLPIGQGKPIVVGELGATYYGKPEQLFPFAGEDAYRTYKGRNEALAIDLHQNVVNLALPYLAYFSPSEVSWFGIEHMNVGYHDFSRLPTINDGVYAGLPYKEDEYGYQYERIPPYVSTFNPGIDPALPLYKPLAMFEAYKAALAGRDWAQFADIKHAPKAAFPEPDVHKVAVLGDAPALAAFARAIGIEVVDDAADADMLLVDGATADASHVAALAKGAKVLAFAPQGSISAPFASWLPAPVEFTPRYATMLDYAPDSELAPYVDIADLYFAEVLGDRRIQKHGMGGRLVDDSDVLLSAAGVDWSLFNDVAEHWKCAQTVLYENLEKPAGASLIRLPGDGCVMLSTLDYNVKNRRTFDFWRTVFAALGVKLSDAASPDTEEGRKALDLLMDGPQW